jgi:hypothetical protein
VREWIQDGHSLVRIIFLIDSELRVLRGPIEVELRLLSVYGYNASGSVRLIVDKPIEAGSLESLILVIVSSGSE